jgi:hypothetical protein
MLIFENQDEIGFGCELLPDFFSHIFTKKIKQRCINNLKIEQKINFLFPNIIFQEILLFLYSLF